MQYGVVYEYWSHDWCCDYPAVARKVSGMDFDVLEIGAVHLFEMSDEQIDELKQIAEECALYYTVNSGPSKDCDLASRDPKIRANGVAFFKTLFRKMERLGSKDLAGAIYSFWPSDFQDLDKEGAWERSISSLQELAVDAETFGIDISLEVLNRNETYILTDCAEAVEYIRRVGSPHVKILLDTYHMNIEEDDMCAAIRLAGENLGHFHIGENNRKLPGMNRSLDWSAIGAALWEIGYQKAVVMEPFLLSGGEVGKSVRVWRDLSNQASPEQMDKMLKDALCFVKGEFEK